MDEPENTYSFNDNHLHFYIQCFQHNHGVDVTFYRWLHKFVWFRISLLTRNLRWYQQQSMLLIGWIQNRLK